MKKAMRNHVLLASVGGLIGPLCFVLVFTIEGKLRPGYDPWSSYVSALSLGPRGVIQIINFVVFGALLALFARGVASQFESGKASYWGPLLLAVIGLLYFISGPFVMDPPGTPSLEGSLHGLVHGIAGGIVFLLMPIVIFVFLRRFRLDPAWRSLYLPTLILGIFCAAADLVFTVVSKGATLAVTFSPWLGLLQRLVIIPFMVWVFLFAAVMLGRELSK